MNLEKVIYQDISTNTNINIVFLMIQFGWFKAKWIYCMKLIIVEYQDV